MIHLLRLHVGWLRYSDDNTLSKLLGMKKDDLGQYDGGKRVDHDDPTPDIHSSSSSSTSSLPSPPPQPFKQGLNKRGMLFKMLVPTTRSVVQNRITHEEEMECPTSWKLVQREEFYHWVKEEIETLVEKMDNFGDSIWSDSEKTEEMNKYDDLEWMIKVCLMSLIDDENFESLFLREVGKKTSAVDVYGEDEEERVNLFDEFYKKGKKESLSKVLAVDMKTMETKKTMEKMVWRGFKSLEDVEIICFNLLMGCRLWRRVLGGGVKLREPKIGMEEVMFLLHIVSGLREGVYFPTIMDPYIDGDGRLQKDERCILFLRDVLLDELSLHLYNIGLRAGKVERDKKNKEAEEEGEKELNMGKKMLRAQWAWFTDLYGGVEDEKTRARSGNVDMLEEEEDDESDITMDSDEEVKRKMYTPTRLLVDGKIRKLVFKIPPLGTKSKMDKWIEKHETIMVKYNIKKTRETMKIMQKEHVMEMRLRKSKKMFIMDQKKVHNTNTVIGLKDESDLPFDLKGIKKKSDKVAPIKEGESSTLMKGKIALHPTMDSIAESFPLPKLFKDVFGRNDGSEVDSKRNRRSQFLVDKISAALDKTRLVENGEDVEEDDIEFGDEEAEEEEDMEDVELKKKELEILDRAKKMKTVIRDVVFVGLGSLTWMQCERTYKEAYPYDETLWKKIEHIMMKVFIDYTARANEKEIVMDAHVWMLEYLFTPLWKRESYKRSGTGKVNNKAIDCWKYAELEFYANTYTDIDFLSPLKDLIEMEYPGFPLIHLMESRNLAPIFNNRHCGVFLPGYFHTLLRSLEDTEINNIVVGDFVNPFVNHPYQHEFFAHIVYWWLKQQLLQIPLDIDRTIFLWEVEVKHFNIYRGSLYHPVISRVGSDWVVFTGGNGADPLWSKKGLLSGINCGRYIFIALYVWMKEMDKEEFNWNIEERTPSLRVWNEYIPFDKRDASESHRRGSGRVNIRSSLIFQLYNSLEWSINNQFL